MIRYGDYLPMDMPRMPHEMARSNERLDLAKAYVVEQVFCGLFPLEEGFKKGTIFPELYKPYLREK